MFISKKKNFRRRIGDDDDDTTDEKPKTSISERAASAGKAAPGIGSGTGSANGMKKDRGKDKPKSLGGPSRLSFGGDEEEGEEAAVTIKAKKRMAVGHGHGHKVGLGSVKEVTLLPPPPPSTLQSGAGEYTKERLAELARKTKTLGGPKKPSLERKAPEPVGEPVVVLKGSLKPAGGRSAGAQGLGFSAPGVSGGGIAGKRDEQREVESRLGLMGIGLGAEPSGITHIPDAAAIAAAKAKREKLRQAQAAPDYIPLAGSGEAGKPERSRYRESGLVREQEDDLEEKDKGGSSGEEDDVDGRMVFVGNGAKVKKRGERGGRRIGGAPGREAGAEPGEREGTAAAPDEEAGAAAGTGVIEAEVNPEEDEEGLRWEEEQLRKGVGKRIEESITEAGRGGRGPGSGVGAPAVASGIPALGVPGVALPSVGWGLGGRKVESQSATEQGKAVMASLRDGLARMREAYSKSQQQMHQADSSLVQTAETVLSLEAALTEAGSKYRFVQELKDYIANLCDFLREKAPLIEELEEHMQELHAERAAALAERRTADNADEMAEAEAAMAAAMAAISRGAGTVSATQAAMAAAGAVREGTAVTPQLDEFGRDVNLQKRMETKRRQQARDRRQARAAARRAQRAAPSANGSTPAGGPASVEGESSSEESESEQAAFASGREEVLAAADSIFKDAAEEYSQLVKVKERLERWKATYPATYRDAYASLSAPALFAPFVRLELLKWDPLHGTAGFDSMNWYNLLFDYGMPAGNATEADPEDPDANLIPRLVEKVALPTLHHRLASCWDPYSAVGTTRAVGALQELLIYVPAESEPLQELLTAVRRRMTEAVAQAEVPAWTPAVLAAVPSAGRLAAQRFGAAIRLLRNIAMWRDVIAQPVLDQLALDELVANRILPHLRTVVPTLHDAVLRAERLLAALGTAWLGTGTGSASISPRLEPVVGYLTTLARSLESRRDVGGLPEEVTGLARRLKRMLVELNEYDRARAVTKTFQLREAM